MILQSHKIDHLTTIIVAPLRSDSADVAIPAFTPQIDIQGTKYTILVPFMAAIDKKQMLAFVYNGEPVGYEIDRAIDRLFLGV